MHPSSSEPTPLSEQARLEALYALNQLDTGEDSELQAIVTEAAGFFNAPIALVSLVDRNRQWFRARHGLDVRETARGCSFCTHAIRGEMVYEVIDPLKHQLFADNPLVLGDPNIRYYCGAPLRLENGRRVGTLCVIDDRTRGPASEMQKSHLEKLAQDVVSRFYELGETARTQPASRRAVSAR